MKRRYLFFITFISLSMLLYVFQTWPSLSWSNVQIHGLNVIEKTVFKDECKTYYGKNIISLSLFGQLKRHLLHTFPELQDIKIKWKHPQTLQLQVIEKAPRYSFIINKQRILVAKDGTVLEKGGHNTILEDGSHIIIIKGIETAFFKNNSVNKNITDMIDEIVSEIETKHPQMIFQLAFEQFKIKNKHITTELTVLKDDTLPIKVGQIKNLAEKFEILHYFLKSNLHKESPIDYIDLRVPKRVIVKYGNTG